MRVRSKKGGLYRGTYLYWTYMWVPPPGSVFPNNGKVGNQVLCPHSRCFGSYFDASSVIWLFFQECFVYCYVFVLVANLKNNQNSPLRMDLGYYLHDNIHFDNMGQDTTLVLLGQPHSSVFDESCIFIGGGHFKQIIKKSTGSKSKYSINLKISPLDYWTFKMYILTPSFLIWSITSKFIHFMLFSVVAILKNN